jgi:hypothetical protein
MDIEEIRQQGLQGEAMGRAINEARLRLIEREMRLARQQ